MICCIEYYLPLLKKDGVMVIEDLQDISWTNELRKHVPKELQDCIEVLDLRHVKGRYDDIVFIIKNVNK